MKYIAGFIGVGNMGGALLEATVKTQNANQIALYDTNIEKAQEVANRTSAVFTDIEDLVKNTRFVFLGVKPNIIFKVAENIKDFLSEDTVIVSMAAGIDLNSLSSALGTERIIRIMPNTPVSVGTGMILYCTASKVSDNDLEVFLKLLSNSGKTDAIDEKFIDAAAALSGCGPAFVFMFAEALADGAVQCGLSRDKAMLYAKQTIFGSGAMMLESPKHPGQLKDEVCSPGGTTIEGVLALENGGFRHTVSSAVTAAFNKTSKLKK